MDQKFNLLQRKLRPHLTAIGALVTMRLLYQGATTLYKSAIRPKLDLTQRYGAGSYALITGGANGIGRAYAIDLAKKGFNLVLMDMNEADLNKTREDILKLNDRLMIKTIVVDFSQGDNLEFYEKLCSQVSNLDVSILINNVGVARGGYGSFNHIPAEQMRTCFIVNIYPAVFMTRLLLNQMQLRKKKSLIINMSSLAALKTQPFMFLYGSSKRFLASFGEGLYLENLMDKQNVDVLSMTPAYISTTMTNHRKGFFVIDADEFVQSVWRQVVNEHEAIGHWKHHLYNWLFQMYPFSKVFERQARQSAAAVIQKQKEEQNEQEQLHTE